MDVETLTPNIDTDTLRGYTDENLDGYVGFDYGVGNLDNSVEFPQQNSGEFTAQITLQPNTTYWIRAKIRNYWETIWRYGQTIEVPTIATSRFSGSGKVLLPT